MSEDLTHMSNQHQNQGLLHKMWNFNPREVFTWQLLRTLLMGQGLAALICGTAISSQYLATSFQVNTPMLQSCINYLLLCATYSTVLLCRTGDGNLLQILKSSWWKYFLLALVDVEANYTVVKAYQYTTITSIQLLDCFVIPVAMILSWWILKTRYRPVHYVAVCVCILGVGTMVGADLLAGRDPGSTSNVLLGDGLVLLSATLYAVSNVCQEYTVKNRSREEFLGMVGLFGTVISTAQTLILELRDIRAIRWSWQIGVLFCAFALCLYAMYSFMPVVIKLSSATSVNLSLLTADIFSLFCGVFLFHYQFSPLYLLSLIVIVIGFIAFNAVATPTQLNSSPSTEEERDPDEPESVQNHSIKQCEISIRTEEEEEEEENGGEEEEEEKEKKRRRRRRNSQTFRRGHEEDEGQSTKM